MNHKKSFNYVIDKRRKNKVKYTESKCSKVNEFQHLYLLIIKDVVSLMGDTDTVWFSQIQHRIMNQNLPCNN